MSAAFAAGFGRAVVPFASHPTTLDPRWIGLAAAIAHRLALSVWLGGLPALILLIGVGTIRDDTRLRRGSSAPLFTGCHRCDGVILASGGILTWYLVGNFPAMIGTHYGHLLSLKLALLGGVLVIARQSSTPAVASARAKPSDSIFLSYARRVKVETLLAVLIVVVASDMAGSGPRRMRTLSGRCLFASRSRRPWARVHLVDVDAYRHGSALMLAGLRSARSRELRLP